MSHVEEIKNITRKVTKESNISDYYILSVECQGESISVTIVDQENAWAGQLPLDDIDAVCKSLNRNKEEYLSEVMIALGGSKNFTFTIENERFLLKKIDMKSNIKIRFCTIPLSKIPLLRTYSSLVGSLIGREENNKQLISNMTTEINELKQDRQNLMKKLQLLTEEKASLETTLYSQFCAVLNSKKQKILHLESQLIGNNTSDQKVDIKQEYHEHHHSNILAVERSMEDITESSEPLGNFKPASPTLRKESKHLHVYDSETDVDTNDECSDDATSFVTEKPKSAPSSDAFENKTRILPKRGTSSNSNTLKRKCPIQETISCENEEQEFNSQSLLDEY